MPKLVTITWKIMIKIKDRHILIIGMQISKVTYKWLFKSVDETSEFNEDVTKRYNDENDERYYIDIDVQYPENLHSLHNDLSFLHEKMKLFERNLFQYYI